jgi:hypothetical protein
MIKELFCSLLLVSSCSLGVLAQAYPGSPDCLEPFAHKIDEFPYVDAADLKIRLGELTKLLASGSSTAKALIQVYGGRSSRSDEIQSLIERIQKAANLPANRLWIRDAGFRDRVGFEFFLLPLECTSYPSGIPDLRIDDVELTDLPAKQLGSTDIGSNVIKEPKAKCPPAARAVRACDEGTVVEVFVVVNREGNVIFARAVNGHPLNRMNATEIAKQIQFRPFEVGGVVTQVSGTIKIVYIKPEEIVTN